MTIVFYIVGLAVASLVFTYIGSKILKNAEVKLKNSQKDLVIILKDYILLLRIYRDFLKRQK